MIHYKKIQKKFDNKSCTTFSHIGLDGNPVEKKKKAYETDEEAILEARKLNSMSKTIHKLVAYKCATCGKWHIGRTWKELTDNDREHYQELLKRNL